jgi:hypothetical protein
MIGGGTPSPPLSIQVVEGGLSPPHPSAEMEEGKLFRTLQRLDRRGAVPTAEWRKRYLESPGQEAKELPGGSRVRGLRV